MNHFSKIILKEPQLQTLFSQLTEMGYEIYGPTVRDEAIVYDRLFSVDSLPKGWTDVQEAGKYRLQRTNEKWLFHFNLGPHSWKKFLFPARRRVWKTSKTETTVTFTPDDIPKTKMAFLGVKACELEALFIQDKVFQNDIATDEYYATLRKRLFLIVTNCTKANGTCFCVSMNTGPKAKTGYDLALTEWCTPESHEFLAESGSSEGEKILQSLQGQPATETEENRRDLQLASTADQMGKSLNTLGVKELLYRNTQSPQWEEIGQRCLSCANCTMVCPTCFCSTVEDTTDLTGNHAERWRSWDSCFNLDFSYVHGGSVRNSTASRYRQWMTHKLASWQDQFGSSGCVGCGRCITWCPVGIDITEAVAQLRKADASHAKS